MKQIIPLLFVAFFIGCSSKPDIEWTKGGTLHTATVKDWKAATEANKIATCADFAANYKVSKNEKYKSVIEMKADATALMQCINEGTVDTVANNLKVNEVAASCIILMNYKK